MRRGCRILRSDLSELAEAQKQQSPPVAVEATKNLQVADAIRRSVGSNPTLTASEFSKPETYITITASR